MIINVADGKAIIDLINDKYTTCLKIKRPVAVSYGLPDPSVGCYYDAAGFEPFMAEQVNEVMINGDDATILENMQEFLQLFPSGSYRVDIVRPEQEQQIPWYCWAPGASYGGPIWIFTQREASLDQERIKYYETMIRNGGRPKVMVFTQGEVRPEYGDLKNVYEDSTCDIYFVIDGHHKAMAYSNCGVPPAYVCICKEAPVEIAVEDKEALFYAYDYLLNDTLRDKLIRWQPLVLTKDDPIARYYNQRMDEMLRVDTNFCRWHSEYYRNIFRKKNPAELHWLTARLNAIRENTLRKGFNPVGPDPYVNGQWISVTDEVRRANNKKFRKWIKQLFGITWEEMVKAYGDPSINYFTDTTNQ
ncbi:hypothetical protein [Chitinophaga sp. Cy-1792]|uniref:hypothetical protein n=1 Tax=Chitinophaga sp. Cy-1792 TaxID=2608339 RepID=UPI00141F8686|nr:hypothetical protein [Chitinophaga sp. Cy-1792]NIG56772.1 hypothetical protein [Chitinophaga sp. Cy-1792]